MWIHQTQSLRFFQIASDVGWFIRLTLPMQSKHQLNPKSENTFSRTSQAPMIPRVTCQNSDSRSSNWNSQSQGRRRVSAYLVRGSQVWSKFLFGHQVPFTTSYLMWREILKEMQVWKMTFAWKKRWFLEFSPCCSGEILFGLIGKILKLFSCNPILKVDFKSIHGQ